MHVSMIILCIRPANGGRRYIVTSPLIGRMHAQNDLIMSAANQMDKTYQSRLLIGCEEAMGLLPDT